MVLPVSSSTCMYIRQRPSQLRLSARVCLGYAHLPLLFYNLEPSKLEGCWSAHPRRAGADSQLVVERQYRRSVSCNVIALADCLVTGGVSGHFTVTCYLQRRKRTKKVQVTLMKFNK